MLYLFLLLFIGLPIGEYLLADWVAEQIGWTSVLALVLASSIGGVLVMRSALARMSSAVNQEDLAFRGSGSGRLSSFGQRLSSMGDAALVLLAGLLLFLPGLATSSLGLVLLVPPVRRVVRALIGSRATRAMAIPNVSVVQTVDDQGNPTERVVPGEVIVGEVVEQDMGPGSNGEPSEGADPNKPKADRREIQRPPDDPPSSRRV